MTRPLTYISEVDPSGRMTWTLILNPEAVDSIILLQCGCTADHARQAAAEADECPLCAGCDGQRGHPLTQPGFANDIYLINSTNDYQVDRQGIVDENHGPRTLVVRTQVSVISCLDHSTGYRCCIPCRNVEGPECCHRLGDSVHGLNRPYGRADEKRTGVNNYIMHALAL